MDTQQKVNQLLAAAAATGNGEIPNYDCAEVIEVTVFRPATPELTQELMDTCLGAVGSVPEQDAANLFFTIFDRLGPLDWPSLGLIGVYRVTIVTVDKEAIDQLAINWDSEPLAVWAKGPLIMLLLLLAGKNVSPEYFHTWAVTRFTRFFSAVSQEWNPIFENRLPQVKTALVIGKIYSGSNLIRTMAGSSQENELEEDATELVTVRSAAPLRDTENAVEVAGAPEESPSNVPLRRSGRVRRTPVRLGW